MDVDISKLLKEDDLSKKPLPLGKEVEGILVAQDRTRLFIDLSPWGTGVIYKLDLQESPSAQSFKKLALGSAIKARIVEEENEDGLVELSLKELSTEAAFDELRRKLDNKEIILGRAVGANKGGLLIEAQGITGFLPSSQLAPEHYPRASSGESEEILKKLKALVGQELTLRVLSIDEQKQSFVVSEKIARERDLRDRLAQYKEGDVVEGEITSVTDFGVFIKFAPGVEGLVHISELDWKLIGHPKDVAKVGDKVKAKILRVKNSEVSLSMRALKEDPWARIAEKYHVGDVVKARVREFHPFGAFAFLDDSIHGLVHISQFGSPARMQKMLIKNQDYDFEITSMVPVEHRMGLTLIAKPGVIIKEEETGVEETPNERNAQAPELADAPQDAEETTIEKPESATAGKQSKARKALKAKPVGEGAKSKPKKAKTSRATQSE